jgi:Tol biopolymer transport system component
VTTEATTQQNRAHGKRRGAVLLSLALGAALAAIVAMTGVTREAEAAFPGANGRIAFESDRTSGKGVNNPTGDVEIFAMNRDGTGVTQLTKNTADDFDPSYSAKGDAILFSTNRDGNIEIYVMDSDGTDQIRLTDNTVTDITPTIAPDGFSWAHERILNGNREIIYHAGAFEENITNSPGSDRYPVFSPDSSKIAFTSDRDGDAEVYTMDVKGMNLKNLTNNSVYDGAPDWSPNGAKIAFTSNRNTNDDIYAMNADGSGQTRLTRNATAESFAVWSPNGRKIAFQSLRQGDYEIFTMKASGESQIPLTNNSFADLAPDWQPLVN